MEGNRFNTAPDGEGKFDPRRFLRHVQAVAEAAKDAANDLKSMVDEAMGRVERGYLDEKDPVYALVKSHCEQYKSGYDFETGIYTPPEGADGWIENHLPRIFYGQDGVTEAQANWLIDTLQAKNPNDPRLKALRPTKRQMKN